MKQFKFLRTIVAVVAIGSLASCTKNANKSNTAPADSKLATNTMISENGSNPDETSINTITDNTIIVSSTERGGEIHRHFLYTETNELGSNKIRCYEISPDGALHLAGTTASGGAGTGVGLGSQGALVLDKDHDLLFAVNAGSNSVSSFQVHDDGGLALAYTENSYGKTPVSVSVHDNLLYVLNTGSDNIHGFWVGGNGSLTHIIGSTMPLSGKGVVAPQISFTPGGDWLVVTEKATNNLSTYKVKMDGSIWPDMVSHSVGQTPFGFDFARDGFMVVSNAAGGAAGAGSATSYLINNKGIPEAINGAVLDHEAAPCWVATTKYGRFAFVTNTATNSISTYYVSRDGDLFLVREVAATTDTGPIDIVVAQNNYFVYALNSKSGTIGEYHRTFLGGLELTGTAWGLPSPVTGLATF